MMVIKREKLVMHNTISHHPLTNARSPLSKPTLAPLPVPPIYIVDMTFYWNIPLVTLGHLSQLCFLPFFFFCIHPHWQGIRLLWAGWN